MDEPTRAPSYKAMYDLRWIVGSGATVLPGGDHEISASTPSCVTASLDLGWYAAPTIPSRRLVPRGRYEEIGEARHFPDVERPEASDLVP
jgi:hypothetical protein